MSHFVVETLYDRQRKRRVLILGRPDGTFGFEEQYYADAPAEKAWVPVATRLATRVASVEDAAREARNRVSWLADGGT